MRKSIIAALLVLVCGSAQAERYRIIEDEEKPGSDGYIMRPPSKETAPSPGWVYFGSTTEFDFFMHQASVVKNKSGPDVWMLISGPEFRSDASGKSYKSEKTLYRLDCKKRTSKVMYINRFLDENGNGKSVSSQGESGEAPIVPDSIADDMIKSLCSKK